MSILDRKVIAIKKDHGNHQNPHEAITDFRYVENGTYWECTRVSMVAFIERGGNAFVMNQYGNKVYCYVRDNGRIKFIQTYSDGVPSNNLLSLPEF